MPSEYSVTLRFKGEAERAFRDFLYEVIEKKHPEIYNKIINQTDDWNEDGSFDFTIETEDEKTIYRLGYEFAMYAKERYKDEDG